MSERKSNPPVDVTLQMGTKDILKCKCGTTDGPRIVKTDCSVIIRCLSCGQKVERAGSLEAQASWNNLMSPVKPYDPRDKMESCKCGRASLICIQYTAFGEAEIKCPICFTGTGKYESVEAAVRAWNKLMHPVFFESFNCTRCSCGNKPTVEESMDKLFRVACVKQSGGCGNHTMRYEKRSDAVANWNDNIGNSLVRDVKDSFPRKTCEKDPTGRSSHEAGAKLDSGKVRMGLVLGGFSNALNEVGKVGTYGANKYSDNGWKEVPDAQKRYLDAMLRHVFKHMGGEVVDPESGLTHLAHCAWGCLAILEFQTTKEGK